MAANSSTPVARTRQRPRRGMARFLSALLVLRLEARDLAPMSAGLILLAWLRRPVIEMPLRRMDRTARRRQVVVRQLDRVYPF